MPTSVHPYYCESGHDRVETILELPFPQTPVVPDCPTCGRRMSKDFGTPRINYAIAWNWSQKNGGYDRDHG